MRKLLILFLLLVCLSILLGLLLSRYTAVRREEAGITDFSIETRAVCEELKKPDCYYRCHDEVFLTISGREMSLYKKDEYVCHDEDWVDPRMIKKED